MLAFKQPIPHEIVGQPLVVVQHVKTSNLSSANLANHDSNHLSHDHKLHKPNNDHANDHANSGPSHSKQ